MLKNRDAMTKYLQETLSKNICEKLKLTDIYKNAVNVACYWSIGSEVRTSNIITDVLKHKKLLLPKIVNKSIIFRYVSDLQNITKGIYGVMEPTDKYCCRYDDIDLMLVPTVAISRNGARLGYGHGYYDRFLSVFNIKTVSLIYSNQIVKYIPQQNHDAVINYIVTENKYFKSL